MSSPIMPQWFQPRRWWYSTLRWIFRLTGIVVFRTRAFGQENLPTAGPVLLLANHQSNLDPVIIGMCCRRQLHYLARETLFNFPPLGWFIRSLNAIPIDRDGSGLGGLKETIRRLKRGEIVLIFPEGTRTRDGKVHKLKPGFCALARRCGVTLVPVAIDGAFDAWPRGQRLPHPSQVTVQFGTPITANQVADIEEDADLVALVEREIRHCHGTARRLRLCGRPAGGTRAAHSA